MSTQGAVHRRSFLETALVAVRTRSASLVYLVGSALARAGSIFLIPLYTRRLTTAEYGDLSVVQAVLSLLPSALSLGLSAALYRFYFQGKTPLESRRTSGAGAKLLIATATLLAGLLEAAACAVGPIGTFSVRRMSLVILGGLGSAYATVPDAYFRAAQRPYTAVAWQIVSFAGTTALGLYLVGARGRGLDGAVEALGLSYALGGVASLLLTFVYLRGTVTATFAKSAFRFSLPFVPHFFAMWLQSTADRWCMKVFHLEQKLGTYALAQQMVLPIAMTSQAWNQADSALMGETLRQGGLAGIRRGYAGTIRGYALAAVLGVLATGAVVSVLSLGLGKSYAGVWGILPFIVLTALIDAMYYPNVNVVYYASQTSTIPVVTITTATLNIALNFALLRHLGVAGVLVARGTASAFRTGAFAFVATRAMREGGAKKGAPKPSGDLAGSPGSAVD